VGRRSVLGSHYLRKSELRVVSCGKAQVASVWCLSQELPSKDLNPSSCSIFGELTMAFAPPQPPLVALHHPWQGVLHHPWQGVLKANLRPRLQTPRWAAQANACS